MKKNLIGSGRFFVPAAALLAAALSGCTSERYAREAPFGDLRVKARYEMETTHEDERVSGSGECSTWWVFIPDTQETSFGYFSDVGSLFSGLSPTQSLALRAAIHDACRKSGADFLLLPRYEMKTTSAWFIYESAECSVTGYPAKVKGLRQVPVSSIPVGAEAEDDVTISSRR